MTNNIASLEFYLKACDKKRLCGFLKIVEITDFFIFYFVYFFIFLFFFLYYFVAFQGSPSAGGSPSPLSNCSSTAPSHSASHAENATWPLCTVLWMSTTASLANQKADQSFQVCR